jgi:hypothetical protein
VGNFCPLLKKPCIEHQCKFYVHLIGNDPQTGNGLDKFDCAVAFIPVLLIEGTQQTRQTGAAIESFRNEVTRQNSGLSLIGELAKGLKGERTKELT